jgi:hypothetical protein
MLFRRPFDPFGVDVRQRDSHSLLRRAPPVDAGSTDADTDGNDEIQNDEAKKGVIH